MPQEHQKRIFLHIHFLTKPMSLSMQSCHVVGDNISAIRSELRCKPLLFKDFVEHHVRKRGTKQPYSTRRRSFLILVFTESRKTSNELCFGRAACNRMAKNCQEARMVGQVAKRQIPRSEATTPAEDGWGRRFRVQKWYSLDSTHQAQEFIIRRK